MITLQNMFVGLVQSYRGFRLRYDPRYESMSRWTAAELGWLARLGEDLGFTAVMEKQVFARRNPVDLAWVEPYRRRVILHTERENVPAKIEETIVKKLLPEKDVVARFAIAIFDELSHDRAISRIETLATAAFTKQRDCAEFLAICYTDIPSRSAAKQKGTPRYRMEWPVRGLHLRRNRATRWLDARCTTDRNYFYTMYMVNPAPPPPNETRRWGTKVNR